MTQQAAKDAAESIQSAIVAIDEELLSIAERISELLRQNPPDQNLLRTLEIRTNELNLERMRLEHVRIELLDNSPDLAKAASVLGAANQSLAAIAKSSAGVTASIGKINSIIGLVTKAREALAGATGGTPPPGGAS